MIPQLRVGYALLLAFACSAAAGCSSGDASAGMSSTPAGDACHQVCSLAQSCGQMPANCVDDCESTPGLLQTAAADDYSACLDDVARQLTTCVDLQRVKEAHCFHDAVTEPGCVDAGWNDLAAAACDQSSCSSAQREDCIATIVAIFDEVPCLSQAALKARVSCTVTCEPPLTSSDGTVTQSAEHVDCSYPG